MALLSKSAGRLQHIPHLSLTLPYSPILPASLSDELLVAQFTERIGLPRPKLSPSLQVPLAASLYYTSITRNRFSNSHSLSDTHTQPVSAPAKQIIALLDLLDRMDVEMAVECERVQQSIRDVRAEVRSYAEERRLRIEEARRVRAEEKRKSLKVDGDFWLSV